MKLSIYREVQFNAAHRLHNANWTDEKNLTVFGKCNNANYHGHNYKLIVKLTGEIDHETGYVFDLKILSELIEKHISHKFDHKNFNLDIEEFKNLIPTAENIAIVIYNILRDQIDLKYDLRVKLFETENNAVKYPVD